MPLTIEILDIDLTVCQIDDHTQVDLTQPYVFVGKTDEELSLVCETRFAPAHTLQREDGWRAFRIVGVLDFSLTGILAPIATYLAEQDIGIFALSTYNTDYVLVKAGQIEQAADVLRQRGYTIT